VPADQTYLQALREIATEIGAVLIFDEVITFRLGYHGAQSIWNIDADLTVFGKIIGGGFPVGAVGGRRDVMAVFDPTEGKPLLPQGGTFSANPMTMICGRVAMELLGRASLPAPGRLWERGCGRGIDEAFRRTGSRGTNNRHGLPLSKCTSRVNPIRDYRSASPDADAQNNIVACSTPPP
jgi:glutamate-1-semialdehyde 2,1-aminomutase